MDVLSATSSSISTLVGMPAVSSDSSSDSSSSGSSSSSNSIGPAASLELSVIQLQGQMMTTLLGSVNAGGAPSLFAGGSMLSLLNAQGSSAMAYLTPQAAAAGQNVNAVA